MGTEDTSAKAKVVTDFIKNVGLPGALAIMLLVMVGWQFYVANDIQRQTLTVIQAHTAAVEVNTKAVEALRDEVENLRRERP